MSKTSHQILFFSLLLTATFVAMPVLAEENEAQLFLRLDGPTIERGYTARVSSEDFLVAVWPNMVNQTATLRLEPYSDTLPDLDGYTRVSPVWVFDILKADIAVKDPLLFSRPLTLALRHTSDNLYHKQVGFWDRNKGAWILLPSSRDFATGHIRALIQLPFAPVAVFEGEQAVVGKASWFRHRYGDTAASNDFAMGSRLRVTDLETRKSVEVTVRSTGPFVPGRVIDLASTSFQQLKPLWQGVASVLVELVS